MAARVVCVASARGGSGRTTVAVAFGAFLAAAGRRVLLVDADPATRGLSLFYAVEDADVVSVGTGLDVLRADAVPPERPPAEYDYVFLDAPAGTGARAAIGSSDDVIIVSEPDPMAAAGVERVRALCPDDGRRTRVLVNKALPGQAGEVPWIAGVARAYARRELALDLEEGNAFTVAVARALHTTLGAEEAARWLAEHPGEPAPEVERELDARRRERTRLLRAGVIRSVTVFAVCFVLALALSLAVTARHAGLRVAGYAGFAVLLVLAFVSRRFVLMRDAIEENDRAIAELEGRRADDSED